MRRTYIRESTNPLAKHLRAFPYFYLALLVYSNRVRCIIRTCTKRRFLRRFPRPRAVSARRFFRGCFLPRRCVPPILRDASRGDAIPPTRRRVCIICTSCATRSGREFARSNLRKPHVTRAPSRVEPTRANVSTECYVTDRRWIDGPSNCIFEEATVQAKSSS